MEYKSRKIESLKNKARKYYLAYHNACDRFSCGASLAEEISPEVSQNKMKFNETMDSLAKIDPATPATRL